jgi:hypothetical protein
MEGVAIIDRTRCKAWSLGPRAVAAVEAIVIAQGSPARCRFVPALVARMARCTAQRTCNFSQALSSSRRASGSTSRLRGPSLPRVVRPPRSVARRIAVARRRRPATTHQAMELASQLDAAHFVQVHRSVVVNLRSIRCVTRGPNETADIHLKGRPEVLPVSRSYLHLFRQM